MTESDNPQSRSDGSPRVDSADKNLVRLLKPVVIADDPPGPIDEHVVSAEYYNRFTY